MDNRILSCLAAVIVLSAAGISKIMPEADIGPDGEPRLFERGDDGEIWCEDKVW